MSDTNTNTPTTPPSPLAAAAVAVFGPREALLMAAASCDAERSGFTGAIKAANLLRYGGPQERSEADQRVSYYRGRLLGAVDQLTSIAKLVAEMLPAGE